MEVVGKLLILLRSVVMMYKKLLTIYLVVFHVLSMHCYNYVYRIFGPLYVLESSIHIDMGIIRGKEKLYKKPYIRQKNN